MKLPSLGSVGARIAARSRRFLGRIMALVGITFALLMILIFSTVGFYVYRMETDLWRGRQLEAARNAAQTVSAFLQRNEEAFWWAALFEAEGGMAAEQRWADLMLQANPAVLEVIRLDPAGAVLADASVDSPVLANVFTVPQSEWFQAARAGREYYTAVQISAKGQPYLIYARPARDGGVTAARIKMDLLWQVVATVHFGQHGRAFVISFSGRVVAHTDRNLVLAGASLAGRPELNAILQAQGREWFGARRDFDGQVVQSVSTPIAGTDWILITDLPQAEAYASTRALLAVLPLGVIGVAFIIMFALRRYLIAILRSVEVLRAGAVRFGQGDLSYRLPEIREDELGEVMRVFNTLGEQLQQQRAALEGRAAENAQLYLRAQHELEERRRAEEALRVLNEQLEDRVQERTQALTHLNTDLWRENAERRRVEAELEAQRDFALHVMNTMGQGLTVTNETGVFEFVNPAYARMVGNPPEILIGQRPDEVVLPEDLAELRQARARWQAGVTSACEVRLRRADEILVNALITGSPRWQQGRLAGAIAVITDLTEQKRVEAQIRASLHEKEVLLKEIHHRVKNNLQVISSLLALQTRQVRDNALAEAALRDSQQRVRSMALIHEKLYQSQDLAQIDLADYVRQLATSSVVSYQRSAKVDLRLDLEPVALGVDQAVPCGLLLNELITNALKHAFADGGRGTLWVALRAEPNTIRLRVADDGPGLPPGLNIFQTPSLGLQLVIGLTEQLRGTVEVARGGGADFRIAFPSPE